PILFLSSFHPTAPPPPSPPFPTRRSPDLPRVQIDRLHADQPRCRRVRRGEPRLVRRQRSRLAHRLDAGDPTTVHQDVARRKRGKSEEHTSELQSRFDLVCRLLLEKKK